MKQLKLVAVLVYLVCPSIFGQNIDNEDSKPSSADYYAKINERYGDLRISLEKRLAEIRGRNFNITNVPHQLSNGLPCSKQQLVLISTPQATWLQLENYEFLLNSKESNKLITAYIGIVNGQKITLDLVQQQTQDQQKRIIAILDPESVYVFQNAIVSYWNQAGASDLNLEEAIARGFTALAYHFGATNQLPYEPIISSKKIATYSELCKQIDMHLDKYQQHQKQLSRQISTLEELQTREKSGFIAYYPNPIYLGEMAWYIRPHDMKYFEYAQLSQLESSAETTYSSHLPYQPKILTNANQDDTAARQQCQQFIREGYTVPISNTTKHLPYIRETSTSLHDYKAEDFNCISGYTFRSDGRTLEKISDDDGFWSSVLFGNYDHMYSTKTNSDILKTYPELKRLKHYASHSLPATHTMATPYIATSASIGVAKHFDDNVYLILNLKKIQKIFGKSYKLLVVSHNAPI